MGEYKLRCLSTDKLIVDNYTLITAQDALVRTEYTSKEIPKMAKGIWQFEDWLPVSESSKLVVGSVSYRSGKLAEVLGLKNLWISFNGYWPERKGACPTTTFKDLEAVPTIQRLIDNKCKGLICATAGNTGRSFTYYCGMIGFPLLVIVAEKHLDRIWVPKDHPISSVTLVAIGNGANYNDAIEIAEEISQNVEWQNEGGVRNVARRDGIGTLLLDAAFAMDRLPDHYFQAVGGGPGPIGVHEMAHRLLDSKIFEGDLPRIHLGQNIEHSPIHNAWQAGRSHLITEDFPADEVEVFSDYLVNRSPAYAVKGGLYDVLTESNGQTYIINSNDAHSASEEFERIEGIDILSPGAIAVATLKQAIEKKEISPEEYVLLNISGGGKIRLENEVEITKVEPKLVVDKSDAVAGILQLINAANN